MFKTFHYKSFIYAGITPAAYTAYLGMLLKEKIFPTVLTSEAIFKTDVVKFILRILVILVLGAPFGALFFLVSWANSNIWVLLLFKTLTPCLGSMLLIFLFSDYLFAKFSLVNPPVDEDGTVIENPSLQIGQAKEPLLHQNNTTDKSRNV